MTSGKRSISISGRRKPIQRKQDTQGRGQSSDGRQNHSNEQRPGHNQSPGLVRVPSGIPGLDQLIEGGFVKDSTILVRGDTGTCKTIFCLQYLYQGAVKYNEPGVYISFAESEKVISQHSLRFGWDFPELISKGLLAVVRYEPHEVVNIMSQGGGSLRDTIESMGAKRLVIDSLTAYQMVFESNYKANESILALFDLLMKWDATTLVTSECSVSPAHESSGRLGFLTDGIINLYHIRQGGNRKRMLEIIKMRDTAHDDRLNLFSVNGRGFEIRGKAKGK